MVFGFPDIGGATGAELGPEELGRDSAPCCGVGDGLMGIVAFMFPEGLVYAAGFRMYVFAPVMGKGADDGKCAFYFSQG